MSEILVFGVSHGSPDGAIALATAELLRQYDDVTITDAIGHDHANDRSYVDLFVEDSDPIDDFRDTDSVTLLERHVGAIDEVDDRMPDFIVDGRFTSEGLSISIYDDNGNVEDETWFTWAEIEDRKEISQSDLTFELEVDE